jgi:FMN phosphatase YigB (HAD superfamily)
MTTLKQKLVFFDVFDTLLTRKVTAPSSVFYFSALQAIELKIIDCSAETYVKLRQEAERLSRKEAGEGQIQCERIFDYLSELLSVSKDICKQLMQLEFEWESKLLFEIPGAKAMIDEERNNGHQIVYVSDMYWSSDVIRTFLENASIFQKEDKIWVSSEHGASKDSGNLFKKIFPLYSSVNLSEIRHFGNDHYIDYQGAIKAGIQPILIDKGNPNHYELMLEKHRAESDGISSLISGSGRYLRLLYSNSDKKTSEIARIIANVAGPSMLMYVLWIMREASKRDIKQLCFISRDGYIPYVICKKIANKLGYNFKIHYVHGSRQSWHIAGLRQFDEKTFNWLFNFFNASSINSLFKRLGTTWENATELVPEIKKTFNNPDDSVSEKTISLFKDLLTTNVSFQNHVLDIASQKRGLLMDYLSDNTIDLSEKTGMIEIGWQGNTRVSFENAIGDANANNLHWFYLGLNLNVSSKDPSRYSTFLFGPMLDYKPIDALPQIFESFCFAPHGSVKGFEKINGKTVATFNESTELALDKWGRQTYLDIFDAYCDNLPLEILQNSNIPNMRSTAYDLLKQFCESPSRADAEIWGDLPFIHDQGASNLSILAPRPKINFNTMKQGLLFGNFRNTANGSHQTSWGAGAWARRDKGMWPIYIFTFLGYIRIQKSKEIRRILRETKHYLVRLIKPSA